MELLEILETFSKSTKTSIFIHIRLVGAEIFHTEGRIDGRKDRQTEKYEEANFCIYQFCERA
jgi:hypothetical protein